MGGAHFEAAALEGEGGVLSDSRGAPGDEYGSLSVRFVVLARAEAQQCVDEEVESDHRDQHRSQHPPVVHRQDKNSGPFTLKMATQQPQQKQEKQEKRCGFCNKAAESFKLCARCKAVGYCSKEHQRSHWKEHKKSCKPTT